MNSGYPQHQPQPYSLPPPPPPPPTNYPYAPNPLYYPPPPHPYNNNTNSSYSSQLAAGYSSLVRFVSSLIAGAGPRSNTHYNQQRPPPYYYYAPNPNPNPNQNNEGMGWLVPSPAAASSSSSSMPRQYVEHQQQAKRVKNDVNVHKDTIRLEIDEQNPDQYLVSFLFDAMANGSVTIYYFAQEDAKGDLSPVYKDMYTPNRCPFQKGVGQKFRQPSGSGIDLGFFELDDLSKPLNGDVFPLVIYAEACPQRLQTDEQVGAATCAQITQAVIQKANDESFQVKVIKQILWANGERYELQQIFGLVDSAEAKAESNDDNADDMGKECVICLSEPRNTAVLPCRHMCMCSDCAKELRLQSNKCPICRQPVEMLMEINVNKADQ